MISYNMTAGEDNKVIWFIKVTLDTTTLYACDYGSDLSLTNTWSSDIVKFNSIDSINENIDLEYGGSTGLLTNFQFEIQRHTRVTDIKDYFNSFAPATSKPYLTSRRVEVGIAWEGITLESQITWVYDFYIEDYAYDYSSIKLFCIEFAELESKELPPYEIQKDFANGVSYYPDAPVDSFGLSIPIVYGDYTSLNLTYSQFSLSPALRTHKTDNNFIIACHKCDTVYTDTLYRYVDKLQTVVEMVGSTTENKNNYASHYINLSVNGTPIIGEVWIQPKTIYNAGTFADIDPNDAYDEDSSTSSQLGIDQTVAFKLGTDAATSDFGANTGIRADLDFTIIWSSSDSNSQNIRMQYYHPGSISGSIAGYSTLLVDDSTNATIKTTNFYFGDGNNDYATNPTKWEDRADWQIEELQYIYFTLWNKNTSSAPINIYNCYLHAQNITIYDKRTISAKGFVSGSANNQDFNVRGIKLNSNFIDNSTVYAYVKGKEFEGWIS